MELIKHLSEGFDLVRDSKYLNRVYVHITDLHQEGLDISLDNNPTYYTQKFNINNKSVTLPVISIFKRKPYKDRNIDGNPIIYALKHENGYEFDNKQSKQLLIDRFKIILGSVFKNSGTNASIIMPQKKKIYDINTGVLIPSTNELNTFIQTAIEEVNPDIKFIPKLLHKLSTDEIAETCSHPGSPFYRYLENILQYDEDEASDAYDDLCDYLDTMPNGKYKKHLITDKDIRNAVRVTMELNRNVSSLYQKDINDKDILLVDDTITYGQSLEEALSRLYDVYYPKSVTILTMFSKKYNR